MTWLPCCPEQQAELLDWSYEWPRFLSFLTLAKPPMAASAVGKSQLPVVKSLVALSLLTGTADKLAQNSLTQICYRRLTKSASKATQSI